MAAKKVSAAKKAPTRTVAAKKTGVNNALALEESEPLHSFEKLAAELGEPAPALASLLLHGRSEAEYLALGTDFATTDILEAAPRFLGTAAAALAAHSKGVLGVSQGVLALAVREAIVLRDHLRDFRGKGSVTAAVKREKVREVNADCRALRDQVLGALSVVVPRAGAAKLEQASAAAPTPEELAISLETISTLVLDVRASASADARAAYDELGLGEEVARALKSKAKILRAVFDVATSGDPGKTIDQRTLDLQDGRVLHLIAHIHRAFRDAHATDTTLVQPPLGRLRRLAGRPTRAAAITP